MIIDNTSILTEKNKTPCATRPLVPGNALVHQSITGQYMDTDQNKPADGVKAQATGS